jgi:hypothetical protein
LTLFSVTQTIGNGVCKDGVEGNSAVKDYSHHGLVTLARFLDIQAQSYLTTLLHRKFNNRQYKTAL